jgi:hypothetical protein
MIQKKNKKSSPKVESVKRLKKKGNQIQVAQARITFGV